MPFLWPLARLEPDKTLSRCQVNVLMRREMDSGEPRDMTDDRSEDSVWVSTTTLAHKLDAAEYVVHRMIHLGKLTTKRIHRVPLRR